MDLLDFLSLIFIFLIPSSFGFLLSSIRNDARRSAELQTKLKDRTEKLRECYARIGKDLDGINKETEFMTPITKEKEKPIYNCPNCGAPITGDKCEYCGTVFRDQSEDAVICYADNRPILTFHNDIKSLQDRISVEEMNANLIRALYTDWV